MFGWEFPPYSSGGLGTACYGLTKALSKNNVDITFVIPYSAEKSDHNFLNLRSAGTFKIRKIDSLIEPYITSKAYSEKYQKSKYKNLYGDTLFKEVEKFTKAAEKIAMEEDFDIIHCHDWMTYSAGIKAKEISGKPLVVHVHATEFDRTGNTGVNKYVFEREKEGMMKADKIIAVSNFTKNKIIYNYLIPKNKIQVVHNGIEFNKKQRKPKNYKQIKKNKMVLFLGRVTLQKGPDYFLYAAKRTLKIDPNITFVIAGSGDMQPFIIEKAAELGIADKVLFTGFVNGNNVNKLYQLADLYVMPSVSEPFGITPLESLKNNTPVLISNQSGVSEVLNNCLKVDFWDIDQMANKIISVLHYNDLSKTLSEEGSNDIQKITWDKAAKSCIDVYNKFTPANSRIGIN